MQTTVILNATAKYGFGGKQYIARITGRDAKFTFARDFVGTKTGKRREDAEYETDEPGLYVTCDIDRRGDKDETYYVVHEFPEFGIASIRIDRTRAMGLAKRMDAGQLDWTAEALAIRLELAEAKDQDEMIDIRSVQIGLTPGTVKRAEWTAALRAALDNVTATA